MQAALVRDGIVINVIEYSPNTPFNPGGGIEVHPLAAGVVVGVGWKWDGDTGTAPEVPTTPDPTPDPVDVVAQIAALQAWARDIQSQVDAATEIIMGGLA